MIWGEKTPRNKIYKFTIFQTTRGNEMANWWKTTGRSGEAITSRQKWEVGVEEGKSIRVGKGLWLRLEGTQNTSKSVWREQQAGEEENKHTNTWLTVKAPAKTIWTNQYWDNMDKPVLRAPPRHPAISLPGRWKGWDEGLFQHIFSICLYEPGTVFGTREMYFLSSNSWSPEDTDTQQL